jgi:CPA1 family monovalent cation:H+ antiporter
MNETFATLAISAVVAVGVGVVTRQRGWGMALPLIVAGLLVSLLPIGPDRLPDPEIILIVILAPLVFGEALNSSYLDLRKVSRPVLALAVGLVITTCLVVGGVVVSVVAMPLAMAIALGAVLAPTDAVAVSAVAKRASLPRRLVSILEGESLVNDGTGLTALRVAVIAAVAGSVSALQVGGFFALAVIGGVGVGALSGTVLSWVLRKTNDVVAANALIVVAPFAIYLLAEEVDGSGILAVVVAALLIAHRQHAEPGGTSRLQSTTVWKHITFILQAMAFFMIGLETPEIVSRLSSGEEKQVLLLIPIVVITLILTRAAFLALMVLTNRVRGNRDSAVNTWTSAALLSWAAARGPVSGLAAFSIPLVMASGAPLPYRDVVMGVSFGVIVVSLLLAQTLGPMARWLKVGTDQDEDVLRQVETALARAALDRLEAAVREAEALNEPIPPSVVEFLRAEHGARIEQFSPVESELVTQVRSDQQIAIALESAMIRAEQEELLRMRDEEGIPDAIVRPALRQLDLREQSIHNRR